MKKTLVSLLTLWCIQDQAQETMPQMTVGVLAIPTIRFPMNHFATQKVEGIVEIGPSLGLETRKTFHCAYYDLWLHENCLFNAYYLDSSHKNDIYLTCILGKENGLTAGYEHLLFKQEKERHSLEIFWFIETTILSEQKYISGGILIHPQYVFWKHGHKK